MIKKIYYVLKYKPKELYHNWKATQKLKTLIHNKKSKTDKIRIAFVVQMPEVWDKQAPVYEALEATENVECYLMVVPAYDFEKDNLKAYGEEREFFQKKYPNGHVIDAIKSDGKLIDVASLQLDYIFYQRPYDHYLPVGLRSCDLMETIKVCYIPYGYQGAAVFTEGNTNASFFRNFYMGFLDSEDIKNQLVKSFGRNVKTGIQKFYYLGYPVFDTYLDMENSAEANGILWTPRWAFDPKLGGSHFMDYKDEFVELRNKYPNKNIVIRPHPLMFENVVKENLMSEKEVLEYKTLLLQKDISIDANKMMEDTIKNSKVLLTDFSSIIITYFMTGKPIIYCPFDTELNELYTKLLDGIYIANSWKDVEKYLEMIERGEDVLYDTRKRIIEDELKPLGGGTKRVVQAILDDYYEV